MLFPSKVPSKGPNFLLEGNFLPNGNPGTLQVYRELLKIFGKWAKKLVIFLLELNQQLQMFLK
jgi:hypothetical protein